MPTHLKEEEEEPNLLLKADDSELFEWVEERLESIGLDGKLYTRVIKSVLKSNLNEEEFELKHDRSAGHELLINEILLASMWKGSDKTDDYCIFRKVIMDFVNRYKSRSTIGQTDVTSSNESDTSDERYEEAFPSLSDACDEMGWIMPRWTCLVEEPPASVLRIEPQRESSSLHISHEGGKDRVDVFEVERHLKQTKMFWGWSKRHIRRRTKTLSASRWNHIDDDHHHHETMAGEVMTRKKHNSLPYSKTPSSLTSVGKFVGEFSSRMILDQSRNGRRHMEKLSSSYYSGDYLISDKDRKADSTTSHVSPNGEIHEIPLGVLFPNLNKNNECHSNNNGNNISIGHNKNNSDEPEGFPRVIVHDILRHPFSRNKMSPSSHFLWEDMRSFIPEYPWSSYAFKYLDDPKSIESNDDVEYDDHSDGGDGDDAKKGLVMKNYPQSPLPYFHPDPPTYAPFPWSLESSHWH